MSEAGTAPGGPIKAAQAWMEAVQLGRYDMAWAMTDPRLRLARAQAWIWNNRKDADIAAHKRDELAEALSVERPTHPLAEDFASSFFALSSRSWSSFIRSRSFFCSSFSSFIRRAASASSPVSSAASPSAFSAWLSSPEASSCDC